MYLPKYGSFFGLYVSRASFSTRHGREMLHFSSYYLVNYIHTRRLGEGKKRGKTEKRTFFIVVVEAGKIASHRSGPGRLYMIRCVCRSFVVRFR